MAMQPWSVSLGLRQYHEVEEMLETFHSQTAGGVREALEALGDTWHTWDTPNHPVDGC